MQLIGFLIFAISIYIAYNLGKIVGRAKALLGKEEVKPRKKDTDGIEEADYEEIN